MPQHDPYLEIHSSQKPAIELLTSLGYCFISPQDAALQRGSNYEVLLKGILRAQLRKLNRFEYAGVTSEFSLANIEKAINDLDVSLSEGLLGSSEKIYNMLLWGRSYGETVGEGRTQSFNMKYIDWDTPENNTFHVTYEYSVESSDKQNTARPDIVLFNNGIPFGVIECKSPLVSHEQAIEQTLRNQQQDWIPQLFKFVQVVVAVNSHGGKYATTGTAKKYWNIWKEEDTAFMEAALATCVSGRMPTEQDKLLVSVFSLSRIMELMRCFVLYDARVKKICRYQQFFAVRAIMKSIQPVDANGMRQSGIIWHTQGSGKSLTMVMLTKVLLLSMSNEAPRIVLVTDRKELDEQICDTFANTRLRPARATSGSHLVSLIRDNKADIITTIINKFKTAERLNSRDESKNVFVLVDESHRSNYGSLATRMRTVFPYACYIGFTGTPLMKKEKNTLTKFGSKLFHSYTIKDGVEDKAIVPLIYEGRFVEQTVDEANIDLWFEQTTKRLSPAQQHDLATRWSHIRRLTSTSARIKRIALDINNHFFAGYKETGFKALLATNFKRDAVRYLECFEQLGDLRCEVLISAPDKREGTEDIDEASDNKVLTFWNKMMKQYGDPDTYESRLKSRFHDGEIDILIVCSKLLTGFDAPLCQVLYIDKELKEHGLLQAIARTNRLSEGKDYGLIVDYRGLIEKLDDAVDMYSGAGLENFERGDLQGVAVDVMSVVGKLRESYSQLIALFAPLENRNDTEEVEVFLADDALRTTFYNLLCAFGKDLCIVLNVEQAYIAMPRDEIEQYKKSLAFFAKLRRSVKIRYADAIDNKEYEPLMQSLLDTHLTVTGLKQITSPVSVFDKDEFEKEVQELGSSRARADAIRSRLGKSISEKREENPAYYDSFAKRITAALEEYKNRIISDAEYLEKMRCILDDFRQGTTDIVYPESIKQDVNAQAFYGVLGAIFAESGLTQNRVAGMALDITAIFSTHNKVDWTHNKTIHDRIAQDIDDLFFQYEQKEGLKFDFETVDKIIENTKTVALRRF